MASTLKLKNLLHENIGRHGIEAIHFSLAILKPIITYYVLHATWWYILCFKFFTTNSSTSKYLLTFLWFKIQQSCKMNPCNFTISTSSLYLTLLHPVQDFTSKCNRQISRRCFRLRVLDLQDILRFQVDSWHWHQQPQPKYWWKGLEKQRAKMNLASFIRTKDVDVRIKRQVMLKILILAKFPINCCQ